MKILMFTLLISSVIYAKNPYTVTFIETHRGSYKNGVFKKAKPEFKKRYIIDEDERSVIRTSVTRLKDGEIIEDSTRYIITNLNKDTHHYLGDEYKPNQTIINACGVPGTHATELLQIGTDFASTSKVTRGVMYISFGKVVKE